MSGPIKDGGPAFPIPIAGCNDGSVYNTLEQSSGELGGMTLRDYFAAKAMQAAVSCGDLPSDWIGFNENGDWLGLATHAYKIADAMLAAREATS